MEMFKVDDNDIQGRLEFNKEWWSAAQEGEPMAGDEIREVRWLIELAGKQHVENERLRKELEEARKETEFHRNAAKIYRKATSDIHNTLRWGDSENALERVETIIELAFGQEGEGNQDANGEA